MKLIRKALNSDLLFDKCKKIVEKSTPIIRNPSSGKWQVKNNERRRKAVIINDH